MNVLITGATGFIGTNLKKRIEMEFPSCNIFATSSRTCLDDTLEYAKKSDFIFHLAAVHRPKSEKEYEDVNCRLLGEILGVLSAINNPCPVLYTSSIQAGNGSAYGLSKTHAEDILRIHAQRMKSRSIIYRLTNTFGPYGRPNGHSVVATFCYNINRGLPIKINDPNHEMSLYYIDDVCDSFISRFIEKKCDDSKIYKLPESLTYEITLGDIATLLYRFKNAIDNDEQINVESEFEKKLLSTFLSYK